MILPGLITLTTNLTTALPPLSATTDKLPGPSGPHPPRSPPSSAAIPHISGTNTPPAPSPSHTLPTSPSPEYSRQTIADPPAVPTSPPTAPLPPDTSSPHLFAHTAPQHRCHTVSTSSHSSYRSTK